MGAMYIIHASITEYLIIFGTSLGTEGHTGRHTADDYFTIRTSKLSCCACRFMLTWHSRRRAVGYVEDEPTAARGELSPLSLLGTALNMTHRCTKLDSSIISEEATPSNTRCTRVVSRSNWLKVRCLTLLRGHPTQSHRTGWIPPMMAFGLADVLSSTLDFGCFFDTARITAREMLKNLVNGKI